MNPSPATPRLTTTRKALFCVVFLLILAVLFAAGAEAILRTKGFKPWRIDNIAIKVEPGGKFFRKHPTLGYSHIPGRFTVTLASGYTFVVTHAPNTLRITRPSGNHNERSQKEEIWIFGCSFTHGWGINDEDTYPWLLQKRFPDHEIVNFGVTGYGTIHSLLQFQDALKAKPPKVAVLAYADFHDARNTFSRTRKKRVAPWNKLGPLVQPYARLDGESRLKFSFADVEYSEFPMMRYSALSHYAEMKYNDLEYRWHRSHAVSEALVREMARLANEHAVTFIVANISGGNAMLDYAERNRILNIDISVDRKLSENTNLPHDGHPSVIANKKYTDKLETFLREKLSN